MRLILLFTAILVAGCNTQRAEMQSAAPEPPAAPASASGTAEPSDASNDAFDEQDTAKKFMEASLERFRAEPIDSTWAAPTQSAIQGALDKAISSLPAKVKAGSVECRQKSCLVEVSHGDQSTAPLVRRVLQRQVYGIVRGQGHECAMALQDWSNPDGSLVHRAYFDYIR